jgi:hypothetical protein
MKRARWLVLVAAGVGLGGVLFGGTPGALAAAPPPALPAGVWPATPPPPGNPPLGLSALSPSSTVTSCYQPQSFASLANFRFVSAELGYGGSYYAMLRARATTAGSWEQWQFCFDETNLSWSIFSNANGNWVSTELGYTGGDFAMLRARQSGSIGLWEEYQIECVDGSGDFEIYADGDNKFVSTELGFGGGRYAMLRARAGSADGWEHYGYFPGCL